MAPGAHGLAHSTPLSVCSAVTSWRSARERLGLSTKGTAVGGSALDSRTRLTEALELLLLLGLELLLAKPTREGVPPPPAEDAPRSEEGALDGLPDEGAPWESERPRPPDALSLSVEGSRAGAGPEGPALVRRRGVHSAVLGPVLC